MEITNLTKNEKIEKILIEDILIHILKYQNIHNLSRACLISKQFNEMINFSPNIIYESISLPRELQDCDVSTYKWLFNKLKQNKIKKLDIIECLDIDIGLDILKYIKPKFLLELRIPLAIFANIENIKDFVCLQKINVINSHQFNCGMEQSLSMAANILELRSLTHLCLDNIKYLSADFLLGLHTPGLIELDLTESVNFNIEDIEDFLLKNSSTLEILRIDGETSSEKNLVKCLSKLKNLKELYISNINIT